MIIAIDPGKGAVRSIGTARFQENGDYIDMEQHTFDEFIAWMENQTDVSTCIYERYQVFRKKARAHVGSKVETAQTIGAIRSWAHRNNIRLVEQPSDILTTAQRISQVKLPADHNQSHQFSAFNHGFYWMYKQGLVESALDMELSRRRK